MYNIKKMKLKVLLLGDIYFDLPKSLDNYDITHIRLLKQTHGHFESIYRAFSLRLNLKNKYKFFNITDIVKVSNNFDYIILFDCTKYDILGRLANEIELNVDLSKTKLYFYFWNKINSISSLNISEKWNIVGFDKLDADLFNYRYVGGFYNPLPVTDGIIDSDVYFVGTDSGRFKIIRRIQNLLNSRGIKTKFIYVDSFKSKFNHNYNSYISYNHIVDHISRTKAILDITKPNQVGLTLRFYEGMFYNKKVITNNKNILNYAFYNPNNILVINEDTNVATIIEFLNKDVEFVPEYLKQEYLFQNWLNRVINQSYLFNDL